MASRKMTFTLPEQLAARLERSVPPRDRSRYLAEALTAKLAEQEQQFIRACEMANEDEEVQVIERELAGIRDEVLDPWSAPTESDAPPR
jgi:hypothetical protein